MSGWENTIGSSPTSSQASEYRVSAFGRRDAAIVGRGITLDVAELPHRHPQAIGLGDVGHLDAADLGGDQRVAVDIGLGRDLDGFLLTKWLLASGRAGHVPYQADAVKEIAASVEIMVFKIVPRIEEFELRV